MSDTERRLLGKLVDDPGAVAEAFEMGVRSEWFEEPLLGNIFNCIVEYWERSQRRSAPTAWVLGQQREFGGYHPMEGVEELTCELVAMMSNRWVTNQLQQMLRRAAADSVLNPVRGLSELHVTSGRVQEALGRVDFRSGAQFQYAVADELNRLRVREEAKRRLAAEDDLDIAAFQAQLLCDVPLFSEQSFRIQGLLPESASMAINAQHKTGKTTFTMNLAHSLITGERFLGEFRVNPVTGKVAILNFEMSGPHLGYWARQVGIAEDRLLLVNLRGQRNPFAHPDDLKRLAEALKGHEAESLIVDPFGSAYPGTNQDNSGEVRGWLDDLSRWARTTAGVTDLILTVHSGWNQERARGASALGDWPDSILYLIRADGSEDRYLRATGRDVTLDEDKLAYDPATRRLSLSKTGGRKHHHHQAKIEALVDPVCAQVQQNPGASQTKIVKLVQGLRREGVLTVSFQDGDVVVAIARALLTGRLRREGDGSNGTAYRHFFVEENPTIANHGQTAFGDGPKPPPTASIGGGGGLGGLNGEVLGDGSPVRQPPSLPGPGPLVPHSAKGKQHHGNPP
jgi:hypothetical protein